MTLRAGTRGSLLAWTQAGWALERLLESDPSLAAERVKIETRGDLDQHTPLATLPGTGLFVKELEAALVRGEIDFAIHSLKDVPFETAEGCRLLFLSREDPRDALISPFGSLAALPHGAMVGTGSPRRIAQLRAARPDLGFSDLRGNLDTRLRKLESGRYQAIVLACAGLSRLGWADRISERLDPGICLPAFGQGVLALECLAERTDLVERLANACDPVTESVSIAERSLMRALGGGCKTALAALAEPSPSGMVLRGMAGDHDTGRVVRERWEGPVQDAEARAVAMAATLRSRAAAEGIRIA
jgi:hydroxymethylbilane synthase